MTQWRPTRPEAILGGMRIRWLPLFATIAAFPGCALQGAVGSSPENPAGPGGGGSEAPGATTPSSGGASDSTPNGTSGGTDAIPPTDIVIRPSEETAPSATMRRLSAFELSNTYHSLFGFAPEALASLPPDSTGYGFDRVVNSQTISLAHLDGFSASAAEVGYRLIAEQRLDDLVSECPDEILPPAVSPTTQTVVGAAMTLFPGWAVIATEGESTVAELLYSAEPAAEYSYSFPAPGQYDLTLNIEVQDDPIRNVALAMNDVEVTQLPGFDGKTSLEYTLTVPTAGPATIRYNLIGGANTRLLIESFVVHGPADTSTDVGARTACANALLDDLGPKAFRRPLTSDERASLFELYETTLENSGYSKALQLMLEGILTSPHFLYLVEMGIPVDGAGGKRRLTSWEVAARLSYAICESPPDEELATVAADGGLQTADAVYTQALRLMGSPCAKNSIRRFFTHWLGVQGLHSLTKSPEEYPSFAPDVREGMVEEINRYIDEMVWTDRASLSTFVGSPNFWPLSAVSPVHGVTGDGKTSKPFPDGRRGILGLPGVLAAHSAFNESNPVKRAKLVLQRFVCEMPPPPGVVVAPPPPSNDLPERERWRQHSESEGCKSCHLLLDPVGFALEGFDGIGAARTEVHGFPVDARGGIPAIGIADGELEGAAELAKAVAASNKLSSCFATYWWRFVMGRLEVQGSSDDDIIVQLGDAFTQHSMLDSMVGAFRSEEFLLRSEDE